ncbi:hypothetical protein Gotur_024032 [Gossypium turneri]
MKRLVVGPMITPEYNEWWVRIINDNIPKISQENNQSIEEYLQVYRNRNSAIEFRASLSKIEEMKKRIEELETVLQNCEIRIKHLEAIESRNNEQLHYFQNQVRSRDHIMEEAMV